MKSLFIRAQWGLGDSIFARPFVREAAKLYDVFLETPWPELFEDLPVHFVRIERKLRTQMKNIDRQKADRWSAPPADALYISPGYNGKSFEAGANIVQSLEYKYHSVGVELPASPDWDLPDTGRCPVTNTRGRPIAFVRPVTARREWRNTARNPHPSYVSWVTDKLRRTHFIVTVVDVNTKDEWYEGTPPRADLAINGDYNVSQLIALMRHSDIVVGGVGFIVPMSIALKRRAFVLLGGHGGHNHPRLITDPRMDTSRLTFAMPERFCLCTNMSHACNKTMSSLPQQWEAFVKSSGLGSTRASLVGA